MNPLVRHFLPSVVRGVYRFDDELAKVQDEAAYASLVEGKFRFLPLDVKEQIQSRAKFNREYSYARSRYFLQDDRLHTRREWSNRAKTFFRTHPYFAEALRLSDDVEQSDKYLEIQFVKRILAPLLTSEGLKNVVPQRPVGPYKLDFAIEGANRFALEPTALDLVNDFYRCQDWLVESVLSKPEDGNVVTIRDNLSYGIPLAALAINSLFDFLDAVQEVVDVDFCLPSVHAHASPPTPGPARIAGEFREASARHVDMLHQAA